MWRIEKSALFKRQLLTFVQNYKVRANQETAERFIDSVEASIAFVGRNPLACSVYMDAQKHNELKEYEFRKWRVEPFPYSMFFRIKDDKVILLEALYAHRMNTIMKMFTDIKS